jgi:type VI secretion system protein ImpK
MERVNELTKDCFNAIRQIRNLDTMGMPAPEVLHSRLTGFIDALLKRGPKEGLPERDVAEMAYAIVALADEIALSQGEPLHSYWLGHMLQLRYFNENLAGEGFFRRLEALRRDARRAEVLEVYYLCLLFGFQGQYAVRGGEVELLALIETLHKEMGRVLDYPEELAPDAEPPDEAVVRRRRSPVIWLSAAAVLGAVAVYAGLKASAASEGDTVVRHILDESR